MRNTGITLLVLTIFAGMFTVVYAADGWEGVSLFAIVLAGFLAFSAFVGLAIYLILKEAE